MSSVKIVLSTRLLLSDHQLAFGQNPFEQGSLFEAFKAMLGVRQDFRRLEELQDTVGRFQERRLSTSNIEIGHTAHFPFAPIPLICPSRPAIGRPCDSPTAVREIVQPISCDFGRGESYDRNSE